MQKPRAGVNKVNISAGETDACPLNVGLNATVVLITQLDLGLQRSTSTGINVKNGTEI